MTFQDRILRRLQKSNNFRYLDDLVNSGKNEVKLTCDIALEDSEELVYGEGIEIKTDDLTHHVLRLIIQKCSDIFYCDGHQAFSRS